mmetsp:Transcript_14465/g.31744  ORF Transcript_14465/g.31744 Transcript_14465/m.31744 type:complete len:813 (-) Transcript_14465:189-2627(-)
MAMLCLVSLLLLASSSASAASSLDHPSLMLLQVNAEKLEKIRRQAAPSSEMPKGDVSQLPSVRSLLGDSKGVAEDLSEEVSQLSQRLRAVQEAHATSLADKRAAYEHNLTALQRQISKTESINAAITTSTEQLKHQNQALLQNARDLSSNNDALRADLAALRINLTTAVEFVDLAMEGANDTEAEELRVIRDLEARHEANRDNKEHQRRLDEIEAALDVSLLHFVKADNDNDEDAQSLVASLQSSFEALAAEERATEASLEQLFLKHYSAGAQSLAELQETQERLNKTKAKHLELHEDLEEAVTHLHKVHETLESQAKQLRGFAESMSRRQASALFQMNSRSSPSDSSNTSSFDPAALMVKPDEVYEAVSVQMNELGERLAQLHQQQEQSVKRQTAEYEERLKDLETQNAVTERENEAISSEIKTLRAANHALRTRSTEMQTSNEEMRVNLQELMINMSTAQEFLQDAFDSFDVSDSPQLAVLKTLAEKEQEQELRREHQQRLNEISKSSHLTLVEFGLDPQEMIHSVSSQLDDLSAEMNSSRSVLTAAFEEKFRAGSERRAALLAEQERLNHTRTSDKLINSELEEALKHLVETQEQLQARTRAFQVFAQRMGMSTELTLLPEESNHDGESVHRSWAARLAQAWRSATGSHHQDLSQMLVAEESNITANITSIENATNSSKDEVSVAEVKSNESSESNSSSEEAPKTTDDVASHSDKSQVQTHLLSHPSTGTLKAEDRSGAQSAKASPAAVAETADADGAATSGSRQQERTQRRRNKRASGRESPLDAAQPAEASKKGQLLEEMAWVLPSK